MCALTAFASLAVQVRGLVGERGILPATDLVARAAERLAHPFFELPGLHWLFGAGDFALVGLCVAGVIASALVVVDVLPGPMLVLAWLLYLTLMHLGQVFLAFQWDILLCEALLAAALLSSWRLTSRRAPPPTMFALVLVWLLAARLDLGSGLSKLLSGDAMWRSLTALTVHYETQPLPTPFGWLAHHLPQPVQVASCFTMFVVQLLGPPLLFVPVRRVRHAAVAALVALQTAIALTGNYTFFNLLTIVITLAAVDDDAWRTLLFRLPWLAARVRSLAVPPANAPSAASRLSTVRAWFVRAVVVVLAPLGVCAEIDRLTQAPLPDVIESALAVARPWELVGGYGLFAHMTAERNEIEIEGTVDGVSWLPYRFKYKPDDVDTLPGFVAPHQPRLDWQMWFAALGDARHNPWLLHFMDRLLEAEPTVTALLDDDPFHGAKPIAVRAVLWRYHVAPLGSGPAWTREELGPYAARAR